VKRPPGKLRIIGGEWRSRVVAFEAAPGVRATPDRVRQTVFDWLAPLIEGATCLDLFAGSGALGLEALSRGAARVTFVDSGRRQAELIRTALQQLGGSERAEVRQEDAFAAIASLARLNLRCDVVFLDPPFDSNLLAPALVALPPLLKPRARVYAEWQGAGATPWPAGYAVVREKQAGQVSYGLATYTGPA